MGKLDGKSIVVTGAGSGIGLAIVERFLHEGARILAFDVSRHKVEQLQSAFPQVAAIAGDVRSLADNCLAVEHCVESFGSLDVFVANAGVFDGFSRLAHISADHMEDAYNEIFNVNVRGYLFGAKAAYTELRKSGGSLIFTLSQASFYPDGGGVLYTASKHAALGILRELAFEWAPDVRVNGVAPGGTITALRSVPSLATYVREVSDDAKRTSIARRNPLHVAMDPHHHMGPYVLLASDESAAMTGEVIRSDGGLGVRGL